MEALQSACSVRVRRMQDCAGNLTYKQLTDCCCWYDLVSPDYCAKTYRYMGRKFTGSLIRFILKPENTHLGIRRPASYLKYVTGTPGFGKTVSLNTAVLYLYLRSIKAMEQKQLGPSPWRLTSIEHMEDRNLDQFLPGQTSTDMTSTEMDITQRGKKRKMIRDVDDMDISNHRFLLISGDSFVQNRHEVLFTGLVMAYIKDPEALAALEIMDYTDDKEVIGFLKQRPETVNIILDEATAFDWNKHDTDDMKSQKEVAFDFLLALQKKNVKVLVCGSVRTKLRELVRKEGADCMLGTGGFNEKEVCEYISHFTNKGPRSVAHRIYNKTGWVPSLVFEYFTSREQFKESMTRLQEGIATLFSLPENKDSAGMVIKLTYLLTAVAGGEISRLSHALDSLCYYRGPDGKAKYLTPAMHSYAMAVMTENVEMLAHLTVERRINEFIKMLAVDTNICRIGWKAEGATLLVLRLHKVSIPRIGVVLEPQEVVNFSGCMTKEILHQFGPGVAALFIPDGFDHAGVDVYYICEGIVVIFQVTVATNYRKCHLKTKNVAEELSRGRDIKVVVVWIVVTDEVEFESASETCPFDQVYVPFGELHRSLSCVGGKVVELREWKGCPRCHTSIGTMLYCDFCGFGFHRACEEVQDVNGAGYCEECRIGLGFEEEESIVGVDVHKALLGLSL